jgi:LPXTG-site transpeptidase (sortase) family protein
MNINRIRRHLSNFLIVLGFALIILTYGPIIKDEIWYYLKELKSQDYILNAGDGQIDSVFARFLSTSTVNLEPVNTEFSIIIEKIGVNAPIVADVPVYDEKAYKESLRDGIAHASSTQYPSRDPGNVYLFAHASTNFWELGRYATVFNLLRKLDSGDKVYVFYKGDKHEYEVIGKSVLQGWNTRPLTRSVIEPILTLQTCDPPGTTINRLVVTAKLVDVKSLMD